MTRYQFSLGALVMVVTTAAFVTWGWPFIVPNVIAIVKLGYGLHVTGFVVLIALMSFFLVRSFAINR